MKRVSSRDPTFKVLRQLSKEAGTARRPDVAWLEGIHLSAAFVDSGGSARQVVVGVSALDDREVAALLERLPADLLVLDDALYDAISHLAHGVRLTTIAERPRPAPPARLVATALVLDRVQDPGNVGSMLRSAAAAGIAEVYLSAGCAGAWSPKVLRAAMGAHWHLRLFDECDLLALKASAAVPWLATSPHAERSLYETDLRGPLAWVFGHEGQGVSAALVDDGSALRIPQPGAGESLNVAASAAVCFFEQVRQRRPA